MLDILTFIVVIFGLAIIIIVGSKISTDMNETMQSNNRLTNYSKQLMQASADRYAGLFDALFLMAMVFLFLAILVGAYYYKSHPVVYVFSIVLMAIFLVLAGIFNNVYEKMANSSALSSEVAKFTFIPHIMTNLVFIVCLLGFVILIIIYGKWKE